MTDTLPAEAENQIHRYAGRTAAICGKTFKLGPLNSYDQALKEIARIARKAALGEIELGAADHLTRLIERAVGVIYKRRQDEFNTRRLDLMGAAAEQGAAVFEGFAIIPPPSREAKDVTPKPNGGMMIEQGPSLEIKKPKGKGK